MKLINKSQALKVKFQFVEPDSSDYLEISCFAKKYGLLDEFCSVEAFADLIANLYGSQAELPLNPVHIIVVSEGKILGHYGAEPRILQLRGEIYNAALSSNLVLKPNVNIPLFYLLHREYIKRYRDIGYALSYGILTKPELISPHLRMGWNFVNQGSVFVRPIDMGKIVCRLHRTGCALLVKKTLSVAQRLYDALFSKTPKTKRVFKFSRFDYRFEALLDVWRTENPITSFRSIPELNKRFSSSGTRDYIKLMMEDMGVIVGFVVLRRMSMKNFDTLAIVDIVCSESRPDVFRELVSVSCSVGQKHAVDLVATLVCPSSKFRHNFIKIGFIKSRHRFNMIAHLNDSTTTSISLKDLKEWPFTWYEHDYI